MNLKNSRFLRRLIILYSFLILIILIMGVYLYSISIKNVSLEIRTQNKLSLEKNISDMDTSFKTMDLFAGQLVTNSNLIYMANEKDNNDNNFYIKAYHAIDEMSVYVYTESTLPIKSHFIYLNQSNYIISLSQFSELGLYYKGIKSYNKNMFNEWKNMLNNKDNYRKFIQIDRYKKFADSTYLYMLPLTEYTFKTVPATLCFEIDYLKLSKIFSELKYYRSGYLYVTDGNGEFAFQITGEDNKEILVKKLVSLHYNNGFSTMKTLEEEMFVTTSTSDYNGWTYYLVQPADASLYSLVQYRNIFIIIILIALFVEIMMVFILSRSNVKKIIQLGNELQYTLTEQQTLQKVVERQKPIIKQSYLLKMMNGNISTPQEFEYARQYLNITAEDHKFSVLKLVAYVNQYEIYVDNTAVTGPDNVDYKKIIQDAIYEYFDVTLYVLCNDKREYSILISSLVDEATEISSEKVSKLFTYLHEHLKEKYFIWTFAGLGDWSTSLMVIWKSYQQAMQAISYATKRKIFCCYADIERDTNTFYYPIELTKQLTNFITSGNISQVIEIFEVIRHENMEVRSLPIHMMKYLFSDIRNTLYKIRFTIKTTNENEAELHTIDNLFEEHMTLKLCEDLAIKICRMFENKTTSNQQINNIKKYIDENYKDPSMCLNKISDEFNISESYFSYLFKEETGINFSGYLGKVRMEHAWKLLVETDISISEIYNKVGYNNSHSFRRNFKKFSGFSPKEVRNQTKRG